MTRELLILRHGKSDWTIQADDFDRPLNSRGRRSAKRIGLWLLSRQLVPDCVICSPALRALSTAKRVCKALGLDVQVLETDARLYEAATTSLYEVIREVPEVARRVLLVGHSPGLEMLLALLVQPSLSLPENGKLLPTAALAHVSIQKQWADLGEKDGALISIIRPKSLPES